MSCLDENTVTALAHGYLSVESMQDAEQHLDDCKECRWLLAELAQPDGRAPWRAPLVRGDKVGRYVVIERIGSGGMGVVYAAYDPLLDRRVALKQLQRRFDARDQAARMQGSLRREAQAMARLSHPNVLPVHDVGLVDDQLYIVMELVAGGSLRQWLKAAPRRWQEIVAAYVAAGQGLSAAHRAGLLHCDFKPDNVLCSPDGRVLVTDFGLARLAAGPEPGVAAELGVGVPGDSLAAAGTPAYMAPEQFRGALRTPQTDQFSFCVALYEALYGTLPYPGRTAAELRHAVLTAPLLEPPARPAPATVRRALQRGLARQPEERFGSMDELLRPLARQPWQRLRRAVLAAAVIVLALGAGWSAAWLSRRPLARCQVAAEQVDPLVDAALRALRQQPALAPKLAPLLSSYRQSWQAAMLQACTATRVRHEQSEATYRLRADCLSERLAELRALTGVLAETPAPPRLDAVAAGLGEVQRCDAFRVLSARGPAPEPAIAAQVAMLRAQLAQATVLLQAGAYERCAALSKELQSAARSLAYKPLNAEALLLQGSLELATGAPARGEPTLKEALWAAQAARHDEAAAQAWVKLIAAIADQRERRAEAQLWSEHARAAVARLGGDAQLSAAISELRAKLEP